MHWSRRRRLREQAQLREQFRVLLMQQELKARDREERLLALAELSQRRLLMEAMFPLAEALHRQDSLHSQYQAETRELLLEVLNSLQPSAEQQIYPRIGQPPPRSSFPSLAS
jgi:hypothetical protein